MKRTLLAFTLIFISCIAFAQTQQGIVKTRGRMVNGQLVSGQRLSGATITLNVGNPQVSGQNGAFSFNVPSGKNYSLVTATKQGYTLADPEYTRRSFAYSAGNPFYVVLEDEAQRQADIREATDKVRRTLKREIRKREDELDELREKNAITQERYDSLRAEFYTYRQKSEDLVKEMAERYASTDYDQLDEFNQQVQLLIEEGELQKADSMIRSKGDITQRVAAYHNVVAANQKEREDLAQRQQALTQSESGAAKTYEDLSQDLLRRSEIFLQAYQQDSALYCLKLRADLDTTNVEAVIDYANLSYVQTRYSESEIYYNICLRFYLKYDDIINIINLENDLALLHQNTHNYVKAETYYISSLNRFEKLSYEDNQKYKFRVARIQMNLGDLYMVTNDLMKCEYFDSLALKNTQDLFEQDSMTYREDLSHIQNNLGIYYIKIKSYEIGLLYLNLSLKHKLLLYSKYPDLYREDLAKTQQNLGNVYGELGDLEKSKTYYLAALEQIEIVFKQNPDAYRLRLVDTLNGVGIVYATMGDLDSSLQYFTRALENTEILFKENPEVYREDMSSTQNNLGNLFMILKVYDKSEKFYLESIRNIEILYNKYPNAYKYTLTNQNGNLVYLYCLQEKYVEALAQIEKSIAVLPDNPNFYDTKGEILLLQGRNEEALAMWKKVLELNPDFLKDYPDGTNLSNGLKKLGLME